MRKQTQQAWGDASKGGAVLRGDGASTRTRNEARLSRDTRTNFASPLWWRPGGGKSSRLMPTAVVGNWKEAWLEE
jgi:hypothetical protein